MDPRETGGSTELEDALYRVYGHRRFRPGQREVVAAVLEGRDCLALMPTGAGKSVTFQLPARVAGMAVLVVSPLLSLMRDQVAGARGRGLAATWLDSTLDRAERERRLDGVRAGTWELIYASPEGLPGIVASMAGHVGLLAVDEAHCISQWGHEFRPAYRAIAAARVVLGDIPTLAVTATATTCVAADITASLGLRDPFVWRGTFMRSNLVLAAHAKDRLTDVRRVILGILRAQEEGSAIVYCLSRRDAAALATFLLSHGEAAAPYHAGMETTAREEVQAAFADGSVRTVVATVAFGMGIDNGAVRLVLHADLPGSVEAYAQEVGRAGRDGRRADCLLLYSWDDVRRRHRLVAGSSDAVRSEARVRVHEMYRFAAGNDCRHRVLCGHFGEEVRDCGTSCDVCAPHSKAIGLGRLGGRAHRVAATCAR